MIHLGLRLTLGGGKQAVARLVVTAGAVAIGATLLLVTLAGINAIGAQNQRAVWLATGSAPARYGGTSASAAAPAADPVWWLVSTGSFGTQIIYRVDIAATGPRSPIPPGIPRLPAPGQFYASPALSSDKARSNSNASASIQSTSARSCGFSARFRSRSAY